MSVTASTAEIRTDEPREPVLDPVERVSEMCFGLFMALTFVGAVSVAGGSDSPRTMFAAALGCNLAWGLVDAVMYLVRTLTLRGKRLTLALAARHAPDAKQGVRALRDGLPSSIGPLLGDAELEAIRARLAVAELPDRPRLGKDDFVGALGIFIIVVATTFPVALPFVVMDDMRSALVVSRVLSLTMLFGGGMALGHYSGYGSWKLGLAMMALGVPLTIAIIALGG